MMRNLVIGGGVIGLSIAYELAKRGRSVTLLEQGEIGRKASWAGAGILPPVDEKNPLHPLEQLTSFSHRLHHQWADELLKKTGIDSGFRACGGIYLARSPGEHAALVGAMEDWIQREIKFEVLQRSEIDRMIPGNALPSDAKAVFAPTESQIRNPHFLQALVAACQSANVEIVKECGSIEYGFEQGDRPIVRCRSKRWDPETVCFACGAWTELAVKSLRKCLRTTPVRGQMVLFRLPEAVFQPIINEGSRYLVPRLDGHVLAGSTIDEVGYDESTSNEDVERLIGWAHSLVPCLNPSTFVEAWAGLRPATYDGFPYLGRLPGFPNVFVATGHFKSGLHLAPATAVVMADLIEGIDPHFDLSVFSPARTWHQSSMETA
jgi:glycine oxidase